jgi:hypothetical protein
LSARGASAQRIRMSLGYQPGQRLIAARQYSLRLISMQGGAIRRK